MSRGPCDIVTASRDIEGAVMTSSDGDQLSYLDKSDIDLYLLSDIIDQSEDFNPKKWPMRRSDSSCYVVCWKLLGGVYLIHINVLFHLDVTVATHLKDNKFMLRYLFLLKFGSLIVETHARVFNI